MKILVLGDTHGRRIWEDIVAREQPDNTIFLGDYFDSYEGYSADNQIDNFNHILDLKRSDPDNVILLTGNHDGHYLPDWTEAYSGYQALYRSQIQAALQAALDERLLQVVHIQDNYLFSHAGITQTWLKENVQLEPEQEGLEKMINRLLYDKDLRSALLFKRGNNLSNSGDDITQGPFWVRPNSLRKDKLKNYTMVVGHTAYGEVVDAGEIVFIDALPNEYLIIRDGERIVGKVNEQEE